MRCAFKAFSSTNIVDFLSYPHYPKIEGTGLKEDFDPDEVAKDLTGEVDAS